MNLKQSIDHLKFDSRMVEINIKNQNLSREELQKHLGQLPDLKDQCQPMKLEEGGDSDSFGSLNGSHN